MKPTRSCGRALSALAGERIPAPSPQAKGRVERRFKTVQDRLVKERRLAEVSTLEAANRFLERDLPLYNLRLVVQPADLHRPRPAHRELARLLCLKTIRCLRKDFTMAYLGGRYQIHETIRAPHVWVEEHVGGTRRTTHQGRPLGVHAITSRPVKLAAVHTGPPPAPGHAEAGASVAPTPAASATNPGDGGEHIPRTCLCWEKENMSILC